MTITRLCLDHLRTTKAQREDYIGAWRREPLVADPDLPEDGWMRREELGIGLVLPLQRLIPRARAVFLLHDAFDYSHGEIAEALQISESSSRQLHSRARKRMVPNVSPRFSYFCKKRPQKEFDDAEKIPIAFGAAAAKHLFCG